MKLKKYCGVVVLSILMTAGISLPAFSVSQDECAIWLCLPGGFPTGCGAAYLAMRDRIENLKPPLPPFASCAVNPPIGSGSHMDASFGPAAYIPSRRVCTSWVQSRDGDRCNSYTTLPERWVAGTTCVPGSDNHDEYPPGCTRTKRYIQVTADGTPMGTTFYY